MIAALQSRLTINLLAAATVAFMGYGLLLGLAICLANQAGFGLFNGLQIGSHWCFSAGVITILCVFLYSAWFAYLRKEWQSLAENIWVSLGMLLISINELQNAILYSQSYGAQVDTTLDAVGLALFVPLFIYKAAQRSRFEFNTQSTERRSVYWIAAAVITLLIAIAQGLLASSINPSSVTSANTGGILMIFGVGALALLIAQAGKRSLLNQHVAKILSTGLATLAGSYLIWTISINLVLSSNAPSESLYVLASAYFVFFVAFGIVGVSISAKSDSMSNDWTR